MIAPKYDNSQSISSAEGVLPNLPMPDQPGGGGGGQAGGEPAPPPAGLKAAAAAAELSGAEQFMDESRERTARRHADNVMVRVKTGNRLPNMLGPFWEQGTCVSSVQWQLPGFGARWASMAGPVTRQRHLSVDGDGASFMEREYAVMNQLYFSSFATQDDAAKCRRPTESFSVKAIISADVRSADDAPDAREADGPSAEGALPRPTDDHFCFDLVVNANIVASEEHGALLRVRGKGETGSAGKGKGTDADGSDPAELPDPPGAEDGPARLRKVLVCTGTQDARNRWVNAVRDVVRGVLDMQVLETRVDDELAAGQHDPLRAPVGSAAMDYFSNVNAPRKSMLSLYPPAPFTICTRFGALQEYVKKETYSVNPSYSSIKPFIFTLYTPSLPYVHPLYTYIHLCSPVIHVYVLYIHLTRL